MDLNFAPVHVLRRISGLGEATAKAIVEWWNKNGGFANRTQLRSVKGIGANAFKQCAGFVRINTK